MTHSEPETPLMRIVPQVRPTVHVLIQDLTDSDIIAQTREIIQQAFLQHLLTGTWTVALVASETRGRWDVGLRGPAGQHFFSFVSSPELVPEFVRHYLTRHLARIGR